MWRRFEMIAATISILWPVDFLKIAVISLVCQFYGHLLDMSNLSVSEEISSLNEEGWIVQRSTQSTRGA
jgi:hypothetical protein